MWPGRLGTSFVTNVLPLKTTELCDPQFRFIRPTIYLCRLIIILSSIISAYRWARGRTPWPCWRCSAGTCSFRCRIVRPWWPATCWWFPTRFSPFPDWCLHGRGASRSPLLWCHAATPPSWAASSARSPNRSGWWYFPSSRTPPGARGCWLGQLCTTETQQQTNNHEPNPSIYYYIIILWFALGRRAHDHSRYRYRCVVVMRKTILLFIIHFIYRPDLDIFTWRHRVEYFSHQTI